MQRRFISDNTAVAGVIEALLLVALVAIILSMIQLYYIPIIMEEKESDHMDQVANQFSNLKSVIEIQSITGIINEGSPKPEYAPYTSISSPLILGSKELPYFVSARSYGEVKVIDDTDARNKYWIETDFVTGISLTSIEYDAYNAYFIPQTYVLEGGGIILKQSDGEVMRVNPAMNVMNYSNTIEINWNIPLFIGIPGKNSSGLDYKDYYIRTNYTTHNTYEGTTSYIHIYTNYPDAWNQSLTSDTIGILWEYYHNGYINVQVDKSTTPDRIIITPGTKSIYIKLTVTQIGVQIGQGTIIPTKS